MLQKNYISLDLESLSNIITGISRCILYQVEHTVISSFFAELGFKIKVAPYRHIRHLT